MDVSSTSIVEKIINKNLKSHIDYSIIANYIRIQCIDMVHEAKCGHPGGPLGLADIFSILYFKHLKYSITTQTSTDDYLILSNGHVCAVRYASMALAGFLNKKELLTFRKFGSRLQGHPSTKFFPEVTNSSGSLGQGLANAHGLALGLKQQNISSFVYVCLSDGECQEGMTWEAAQSAGHYHTDNLICFIDANNIQIDGNVSDVMQLGDLKQRFVSLNWEVHETDGHNMIKIDEAFHWAKTNQHKKPKLIIFRTILGKGVSFMENNYKWHGVAPNNEDHKQAIQELESQIQKEYQT